MCVPFVRDVRPICTGGACLVALREASCEVQVQAVDQDLRGRGRGALRDGGAPKDGGCSHRSAEGGTVGGGSRPVSTGGGTRCVRLVLGAGRGVSA